jgi:four helix bundle protein
MLITEQLDVFKLAHSVTLQVYRLVASFPKDELYGLSSQMKRAAVSINSNLMEGGARKTDAEKRHFASIARGSASELKYQIMLAGDLDFINGEQVDQITNDLNRILQMLSGLIKN